MTPDNRRSIDDFGFGNVSSLRVTDNVYDDFLSILRW